MSIGKTRVAVVENDEALRTAVGRLLHASGYDALLFHSAEAYLNQPTEGGADILLLDIGLDGMSGLDLQKKLVNEKKAPPIIFITGQSDLPTIGSAIDYGCIAYLHKPFEAHTLFDALAAARHAS